ncbi:MAG TPA: glycosyltransferase [Candidatus Acidoferrum sp.]|nr:glycosyltransferase [Candidatus Acidoferrum sp.]
MSTDSPKSEAAAAVSEPSPNERITAIVPARNEEMTIETCVRSLARQGEIAEIFVVNDHSTDRTAEVVRGLMGEIRNLQLLEAREIPAGWLGKNHAVWEGAKHATSRWLLFTDADAELRDGATARALRIAEETRAALVSFSPEQITEAWYERALIPFVYYRLAKYFPYDAVNDAKSGAAAANGQFLMIRGDVYDAIGGHESVAGEVLEDVALAKRAKAAGYRIWFGSGAEVVCVRMYRSFGAMWEGWKKNLYLLVGGTPGAVYRELFSVVPWIPFALLALGLKAPIAFVAGLGLLLARHAVYASTLLRNQFRGIYILYYIPAVVLYAGVLWASYRAHAQGVVEWKGRRVSVKAAG